MKPNYTNKLNHADAVKYCEARNMRLPTALELKTLIDSTPHMALATRYGWPIGDLCGGGGWTKYWTISPAPIGFAYTVDLKSSLQEQSSVTKNNLFTCIKK
nr:DUF823 domain-containing adhesin [Aeromonas jandaei]